MSTAQWIHRLPGSSKVHRLVFVRQVVLIKSGSALARVRPMVAAGLIAVARPMSDRAAESHF